MRRGLLVVLIAFALACELTEVTVPEGESRVVVQAVLSVGAPRQIVVVERSLTGSVPRTQTDASIPPGKPRLPITDATVILMHEGPSSCDSPVDTLVPEDGLYYTGFLGFCNLIAGDLVRLRVETPDGTIVTGHTRVPGASLVRLEGATTPPPPGIEGAPYELDSQRDTLQIIVVPIIGRALQVEAWDFRDSSDVAFYLFTDAPAPASHDPSSLGLALPVGLINPFEGDTGKPIFAVGTSYTLTVAVTDSNYYDFLRSGSDPITGRGFLNHLEGGIGVFGSVAPYRYTLHIVR